MKGKKRGGRRGRGSTTRAIERAARQRQAAWLDGEPRRREPEFDIIIEPASPVVKAIPYRRETAELTAQLDDLYGDHRAGQAGTLTDPFNGRTWRAR